MGFVCIFSEEELQIDKLKQIWPDAIKANREDQLIFLEEKLTEGCKFIVEPNQGVFFTRAGKALDMLPVAGGYIYHSGIAPCVQTAETQDFIDELWQQEEFPKETEIIYLNSDKVSEEEETVESSEVIAGSGVSENREGVRRTETAETTEASQTADGVAAGTGEPEAPLFCPFCTTNLADFPDAKFCVKCGKDLTKLWGVEYGIYRDRIEK